MTLTPTRYFRLRVELDSGTETRTRQLQLRLGIGFGIALRDAMIQLFRLRLGLCDSKVRIGLQLESGTE